MNEEDFKKWKKELENDTCNHCMMENHLRAYLGVMADEPDGYIKLSEVYRNLKMILGDKID